MRNTNKNLPIARGFRAMRLGRQLLKKPSKTEFEERAAKSFKLSMISTLLVLVILFVITIVSIVSTFTSYSFSNYSSRRTGTVEGDKVRYVQNTMKYVSLEDLDINEDEVMQGEKLRLFFDAEDMLMGGELESKSDTKIYNLLIVLGVSVVSIIIFIIVIRTTYGKAWYQWINSIK